MNIIVPERPRLTHTLCFMFSGKAGVGKSFCSDSAQKMCDELGLKTYKSPFARGVKATASFMGWDGEKDARGRTLLQSIGNVGRDYNEDMWVKAAMTDIEDSVGYPYDAVFMDDWRFHNEYYYICVHELLYKPVPIRIEAPERESLRGTKQYFDESEVGLDNFDFPMSNCVWNEVGGTFYLERLKSIVYSEIAKCSR